MKNDCVKIEVKINIEETPREYIDGIIGGLVYSGYDVYFDMDRKNICFTGWKDELITEIKE